MSVPPRLGGIPNDGAETKGEVNHPIIQQMKLALTNKVDGSPAKMLKRSKSVKLARSKTTLQVQNLNKSTMGTGERRNVTMFGGGKTDPPSPGRAHEDDERLTCCQRFTNSMADRSLFIFHRDSRVRQWCLELAEQPEVLEKMRQLIKNGTIEDYDLATAEDPAK